MTEKLKAVKVKKMEYYWRLTVTSIKGLKPSFKFNEFRVYKRSFPMRAFDLNTLSI